jgi:hypothetical protein
MVLALSYIERNKSTRKGEFYETKTTVGHIDSGGGLDGL